MIYTRKMLLSLLFSFILQLTACAVIDEDVNPSARVLQEDPAVTRLREYLRLKAVHPDPDYNSSIAWIKNQANKIGLEYNIKEFEPPGLFAIWLTWRGKDQSLSSIFLNSHIDVVPVDEAKWTHDPFGAEKDEFGNIYARGAQDMKDIGVQYLEAVRNLKSQGVTPLRNVIISFVPDEELNGVKGMKLFSTSEEFKRLNVGLGLDEGVLENDDKLRISGSEKVIFQVEFTARGKSGHGSILLENTAAEKIQRVINAMLELSTKEKLRMETNNLSLGDVTTINLTLMKGGIKVNVVPTELSVTFDIRITPFWNLTYVEDLLEEVRVAAGPNVTLTYIEKATSFYNTPLTPDNVWWNVFQTTAKKLGRQLIPAIHNAATDARYLRKIGIPAFGFTTLCNTPLLIHDNDEFINENRFLEAIKLYEQFLPNLFNLEADTNHHKGIIQPNVMQNLEPSPKLLNQYLNPST